MSIFNIDNTIVVDKDTTPKLKANEIHKVYLAEVMAEDKNAKDGKTYQVIYLKFINSDGAIYEHRFFPPTATESTSDGSFGKQPSDLSQFRYSIQHLIEALNPGLFKQIKEGKTFNIKDWASMRKFVVQALTPGINTNVYLKLIADTKGYSCIPKYPVAISKAGELYMRSRFIASEEHFAEKPLVFTDQEKKNMESQAKASKAKPSNMTDVDFEKSPAKEGDPDFDI